ncbi:uracil phosphoribosyltransferase [Bdellovibrio reynosensis]|uniref:Uracil phosphoribosyltransferase n=1 Tax=Bdellovibrio reynosensis TaxID=2835041 RepID=A0ABY4C8A8_9BACT|nr:uracil phosphoribosyltransferase [Bdellovibrio reynosensis]UOF01024.1 uracil phosphoribosyltransferase [Bdellovibrio reynosensis]
MEFQRELDHRYGPQVHIIDSPFLNGLLAQLCSPQCFQPDVNRIVEILYNHLISITVNNEFAIEKFESITRMNEYHPDVRLKTSRIAPEQKAVTVNLARAGTYPSHICYNFLHYALPALNIRQDHIFSARVTNNKEVVTGAEFGGMKIGGDVKNAHVIFPDPMGATGNTMVTAVNHYKTHIAGPARKFIALNLIVTPEYLKNVLKAHPDVVIYALRLDRGLSPQAVLDAIPGQFWDQERGLNDKQYIVPGGGGFGEIMNNSFV